MFQVPILLVLYNRVADTHNLFQVIKALKPSQLYVAADGAIHNDRLDYLNCLKTRAVIMPEWECEVHEFFNDEHYGKSKMIFQAVSWFFSNVEEGIILFDDTLPNMDFFYYCEELLIKYRNEFKISHIGGTNFQKRFQRGNASYYFSAYSTTWGFATWSDRWKNFDIKMTELDDVDFSKIVSNYVDKPKEKNYWTRRFNILKKYDLDIWEYQYNYHIWYHNGLSITPNLNLVTNVGLKNRKRKIRKLIRQAEKILPLTHPEEIVQNIEADRYAFKHVYNRIFIQMFADWFNEYLLGKKKKI
jgi:hypothetical protein